MIVLRLARVEVADPERVLLGVRHHHVVQEVAAVRQERRPARTRARPWPRPERRAPCECLPRRRSSTAGRWRGRRSRITPSRAPRAVGPVRRVADRLDRPSGHGDTAQLPAGHEGDRAAVGRPDRAQRAFGARRAAATRARRAGGARSLRFPSASVASKASRRPSGERTGGPTASDALGVRDLEADDRRRAAARGGPRRRRSRSRPGRRAGDAPRPRPRARAVVVETIPGSPAREPPSAIHCELRRDVARALPAVVGVLLQALAHHVVERRRRTCAWTLEIGGGCADTIAAIRLVRRLALEGAASRGHLVEHGAEREDVGARVGRLPLELLGRHVLERADDRALLGERPRRRCRATSRRGPPACAVARRAARPKSSSLAPPRGQHDVAGLQVAVHDPGAVRGVERLRRSALRGAGRLGSGSGPFASRCASDSPSTSSSTR